MRNPTSKYTPEPNGNRMESPQGDTLPVHTAGIDPKCLIWDSSSQQIPLSIQSNCYARQMPTLTHELALHLLSLFPQNEFGGEDSLVGSRETRICTRYG